jgi:hypothetical protein
MSTRNPFPRGGKSFRVVIGVLEWRNEQTEYRPRDRGTARAAAHGRVHNNAPNNRGRRRREERRQRALSTSSSRGFCFLFSVFPLHLAFLNRRLPLYKIRTLFQLFLFCGSSIF